MNKEQFTAQSVTEKEASEPKELYKAPQVTVHGKLERLTLQDNYTGNSGNEGA